MTVSSKRKKDRANVRFRNRGVYFHCPELSAKDMRVVNISENGLGLDAEDVERVPRPGTKLEGRLSVGRTVLSIKTTFIHKSKGICGFAFFSPETTLAGIVRSFFEPELAGASLRLSEERKGNAHQQVFVGANENRMQLTGEDGRVIFFAITVLGNRVEWKRGGKLEFVQGNDRKEVGDFLRTQLIKYIQGVDAIDEGYRVQIERVLCMLPPDPESDKK